MSNEAEKQIEELLAFVGASDARILPPSRDFVKWTVFAFGIVRAVHGTPNWQMQSVRQRRLDLFWEISDRLFRRLLIDAQWGTDAKRVAAKRLKRLVVQTNRMLAEMERDAQLLPEWEIRFYDVIILIFRLGAQGYLRGAITFNGGETHEIQPAAWFNQENWESFHDSKTLDAGDVPLSPRGNVLLPTATFREWSRLIAHHKPMSIAAAELVISAQKLDGEKEKEWLYRRGVRGPIPLPEALSYARERKPDAENQAIRQYAKSLQTAARRLAGETN